MTNYKNLYDFFDFTNIFSVIQFNIFNTFVKNILIPIINNIFDLDYKLNDFYILNVNITPFLKDIIILIIIFFILSIYNPIKY